MVSFSIVVASTQRGGIGLKGGLPWKSLPTDMKAFKALTSAVPAGSDKQNAVIMGRKTWESIPAKFRPLAGRLSIVLSRSSDIPSSDNVRVVNGGLDAALSLLSEREFADKVHRVFVAGGGAVYEEALSSKHCHAVYLTQVLKDFAFDVSIPEISRSVFDLTSVGDVLTENSVPYQFLVYTRKGSLPAAPISLPAEPCRSCSDAPKTAAPTATAGPESKDTRDVPDPRDGKSSVPASLRESNLEEMQYLNLVREIIDTGVKKGDRTGTGTVSKFGCSARYSLRGGRFPLLTTKRVFWKGVVEELLWLVRGCTDANELSKKQVKIWDGNASRAFLNSIGQGNREEGDLGPVYGFQWRHFGASYVDCHRDYKGQGVDQLTEVVDTIKKNPTSRRILMSAWNPLDLPRMALPPCHVLCQFYVADGELSCIMYQRSCDLGLGVPFNIASYSLLTCMIAHLTGLKPGEFVHFMGDTHVYLNHVEPLREQIARTPGPFPTLRINPKPLSAAAGAAGAAAARTVSKIDEFVYEDFELIGYNPQKPIKMDMAV